MYIKKNTVFSYFDEEAGEERQYSVNEILSEDEYRERMYAVAPLPNLLRKTRRNIVNTGREVMGTLQGGIFLKVSPENSRALAAKRTLQIRKQNLKNPGIGQIDSASNMYRKSYRTNIPVDFGGLGYGLPN